MIRTMGWGLVIFVIVATLFFSALALGSGAYCTTVRVTEARDATITTYSCVGDDGAHYMMEVTCPVAGGPCRTRVY